MGLVLGGLLALLEGASASLLAGGHAVGRFWALPCLVLLVAAATLATLLVCMLGRPGLIGAACFLGYMAGHTAAAGAHARRLPMAPHWDLILALLLPVGLLATRRLALRMPRRFAALGVVVFLAAAFTQRGRYLELREIAAGLAALFLIPLALDWGGRLRPRLARRALVMLVVLAIPSGLLAVLRPEPVQWAQASGSATTLLVARLRTAGFLRQDDGAPPRSVWPDYFEGPLPDKVQSWLDAGEDRRPEMVVFVTVDALRADVVGRRDGNGDPVTPTLDRMAREGFSFSRAYAPAPGTHLSFFGFLSGFYPSQYLAQSDAFNSVPLITERLQAGGVQTRASFPVNGLTLEPETFRRHHLDFEVASGHPWEDPPVDETLRLLLEDRDTRPCFAYWHILRAHFPYEGQGSLWERYLQDIHAADHMVERLLAAIAAKSWGRRVWVVVSADHGEEFEEHGALRHGTQLYEESVHVPLIVWGAQVPKGTSDRPVSLVEIPPTLEEIFRLPTAGRPHYAGRSLLPLMLGYHDAERPEGVLIDNPPVGVARWNTLSAVATREWKLITNERTRTEELFDLAADPHETRNLAYERPQIAAAQRGLLRSLRAHGSLGQGDVYADLEGLQDLFMEAEAVGPGAVLAQLRLIKHLPRDLLVRYLLYIASVAEPVSMREAARSFQDNPDPLVQGSLEVLKAQRGLLDRDEVVALVTDREFAENADWEAARHALAARFRIPVDDRDAAPESLRLRLLRALSHLVVRGEAPPDGLCRQGLRARSAWTRLEAARLARHAPTTISEDDLLSALDRAREPHLARELLLGLDPSSPRSMARLLEHLDPAHPLLAQAAMARLAAVNPMPPGLTAISFADPKYTGSDGPFMKGDPIFARGRSRTMRLPYAKPPGEVLVGLFLTFPSDGSQAVRLMLRCGARSWPIDYPPRDPALPVIIPMTGNESAPLVLEIISGDPRNLRLAGLIACSLAKRSSSGH